MTAPWTLNVPVVEITRPQPAAVAVSLPPRAAITVRWPPLRVTGPPLPPAPGVIHLAARPQGPRRQPLAPVLRYMLASPPPPRRR